MAERDWIFEGDDFVCGLRAAGILVRDGKILLQREAGGREYAVPGGHVKVGEELSEALAREYAEELGISVSVGRLLFTEECFWEWKGRAHHDMGFYFEIETRDVIPEGFRPHRDNPNVEVGWIPVEKIGPLTLYPEFLKEEIHNLPDAAKHFVTRA